MQIPIEWNKNNNLASQEKVKKVTIKIITLNILNILQQPLPRILDILHGISHVFVSINLIGCMSCKFWCGYGLKDHREESNHTKGWKYPWVVTSRNHLKEWKRNQKQPNHFPRSFILNVFTTKDFISHAYQFYALIYGLKFILEQKKLEFLKLYLIKIVSIGIESLNFENS
jgi:hypothetical protein